MWREQSVILVAKILLAVKASENEKKNERIPKKEIKKIIRGSYSKNSNSCFLLFFQCIEYSKLVEFDGSKNK